MANLTIVANIHAHADKVDLVKAEPQKLIETTRGEEGCIQYDLHQDNEDPAHFLFYENWESRDLWRATWMRRILPPMRRQPTERSRNSH